MSKSGLRKELGTFSQEQLIEVVLAAYDASPQARDYFEYFLNPDADKLYEKKAAAIDKECCRIRYGRARIRVTVIRRILRDFAAYQPGAQMVGRLTLHAFSAMIQVACHSYITDVQAKAIRSLACEYMNISAEYNSFEKALQMLHAVIDRHMSADLAIRFKQTINNVISNNNHIR